VGEERTFEGEEDFKESFKVDREKENQNFIEHAFSRKQRWKKREEIP